jgi:uncharacterized membrane protein YgcG
MPNWYAELMGSVGESLQFEYNKDASRAQRRSDQFEADLMLDNAKARLAAATRRAGAEFDQSRELQSDAVAAMVAQGGTVDTTMLAKLKTRGDYNAIATLFDGQMESIDMRMRGYRMHTDAMVNQKFRALAAEIGAYGDMLGRGSRALGGNYSGMTTSSNRPQGYDWRNVQSQGMSQGRGGYGSSPGGGGGGGSPGGGSTHHF